MPINELTVMFYFGGDDELSPITVSQIKAIKDAGYQKNTEVLVYFDSHGQGAPTMLCRVNRVRKAHGNTKIGDGRDPFVRNLLADMIEWDEIDPAKGNGSQAMIRALVQPDLLSAEESLGGFVQFCRENYRARNYVLVLVGHGMIVASDSFLPDQNPSTSITLRCFGKIIREFNNKVKKDGGVFQLLALHSCSMSAVELAFELEDTAQYMMASEGLSWVGGWPYRQLLKKMFVTVNNAPGNKLTPKAVAVLVRKLYKLTMHSSTDLMIASFSLDLTLIRLGRQYLRELVTPLRKLIGSLRTGLNDSRLRELIVLAHWESQSYWGEEYTDLVDFCELLGNECDPKNTDQGAIKDACALVVAALKKPANPNNPGNAIVLESEYFGWKVQYSRGLSIYFPWSQPFGRFPIHIPEEPPVKPCDAVDPNINPLSRYKFYAFTKILGNKDNWLNFLEDYFVATQRPLRRTEEGVGDKECEYIGLYRNANLIGMPGIGGNNMGALEKPSAAEGNKPSPAEGPGDKESAANAFDCICPTVKNYKPILRKPVFHHKRKTKIEHCWPYSDGIADSFE